MSAAVAISVAGAGFAAICGIPLLTGPRFRAEADRLFGVLMALAALILGTIAAQRAGLAQHHLWLARADFVLALGVGPVLYFYERVLADPCEGISKADAIHGVPAVGATLILLASATRLVDWVLPFTPILAVLLVYVVFAALAWTRGQQAQSPEPIPATRHLSGIALLVVMLVNLGQLLRVLPSTRDAFLEAVPVLTAAGVLVIGALGFLYGLAPPLAHGQTGLVKYQRSSLDRTAASEIVHRLHALMTTGKPFRDPELSLDGLAARLSIPRHHLSQLLNQHLGVTYLEYINSLRVEDAKIALIDTANDVFTIEGVARSAGFASRSAFYKAFRGATGLTPTAFRRIHRVE